MTWEIKKGWPTFLRLSHRAQHTKKRKRNFRRVKWRVVQRILIVFLIKLSIQISKILAYCWQNLLESSCSRKKIQLLDFIVNCLFVEKIIVSFRELHSNPLFDFAISRLNVKERMYVPDNLGPKSKPPGSYVPPAHCEFSIRAKPMSGDLC